MIVWADGPIEQDLSTALADPAVAVLLAVTLALRGLAELLCRALLARYPAS